MKKVYYKMLFLSYLPIVITFYLISSANAQNGSLKSKENGFWCQPGIGATPIDFSLGLAMSFQTGINLISLRTVYNAEWWLKDIYVKKEPTKNTWDIGVLYGLNLKSKYLITSFAFGIGLVNGIRRGKYLYSEPHGWLFRTDFYERESYHTLGIPIEVQIFVIPFSFWGQGLYGFANINKENSFVGVLLAAPLGKLR